MNRINITFSSLTKTTWTLIYQFVKSIVYDIDLKSKGDFFTKLQSVASRIMIEANPIADAKTGDGVDLNLNHIRSLSIDTCFGLIYQNSSDDEDFTGLVPFILLKHEFKDAISLGIDVGLLESSKHSSYSFKCGNFFYLIENNPPKLGNNSIYIINEIRKIDKSSGVIEYVSPTNRISRLKGKGDSGYSGAPSRRFLPLIKITESNFRSIFVKNESSDEKNKPCDLTDLSFVLESIDKIKQDLESNKAIRHIWPYLKEIFEESQSPFEQWLESGYFYSLGIELKNSTSEKIESDRKTLQIYKNSVIELVQNIIFHAGKEGLLYCVFDEKNNVKKGYGDSIFDFDTYKDSTRFLRIGVFDYCENGIVDTFCDYLKTNPYSGASEDINSLSLLSFFDTNSIVAKGLTRLEMRYAARLGIKAFVKTIINHKGFFSVESNCHNHNGSGKKQIQTALIDNVIKLSSEVDSDFANGTHYEIILPIVANENDKVLPFQSDSLMSNSFFNVTNEKNTTFSWLIRDISDFDFELISSSTNKKEQIDKIRIVSEKVIDEVNQKNKNYDGIVWDFEGKELDYNIVFKLISFLQLNSYTGFKRIILVNTTERFIKGLYDILNALIIDNEATVWSKESAIIVYSESMYSMIIWGKAKDELYYINQESQRFNYNYFFQESPIIDWNSKSVLNSIDNKTKSLVKQFVLPYDILINTGKEKHASLFECFLNRLLKTRINPNNLGFLVNHENTYIGNKIIVKNYYEADMMFQNNYFTERFAYMIAHNIKNEIISKNRQNKKIVLIGYNHYSEVLLKSIEKWLKIMTDADNSSFFNEVNLAIFIEVKETFAADSYFDFDIDKKQNVEKTKKDILKNPKEFLFVTIVPIGSTLSTNDKIIALFRKLYKDERKQRGDYTDCLLEDVKFIYNHCVVVVRDSDGADVSVQERCQRWESIDLSERVIRTGYTNAKEIHFSTQVARAMVGDSSNWVKRLNEEISFREKWWEEKYVNYTENSSINSQNLMGFPRIEASELNEDNHCVELDRLFDLRDDIFKGHIEVLNCHHKYYIDTEKFVKRNNAKLDKWLREEVKADGIFNQGNLNVIITPNVERESDFIFKIKESIFNGNALVINLDVNNWRNNMLHKLSYLKNIQKTKVKFHYVDQAFLTGETYHKSKSYLFSILDDTDIGYASIITVINRLTYAMSLEIKNDVKGKFFAFINLHYPGCKDNSFGNLHHNGSKERERDNKEKEPANKEWKQDCELCQLDKYYRKLSSRTVLDSCNNAIIKNRDKLLVEPKTKKDRIQCSKRGFIRLVLTHEIYYRIAEIVQRYSKEAYDYDRIYSEMEGELNGLFKQLSQSSPHLVQEGFPKSIINQKIDDWLTLKCIDNEGELSGELNAVFLEKLRVDKKISFLKVISSPPLSKYIAIRKYAHEKLLNELHLMISRTNNKQNDFVYDDLKLIKSILKSLSFLKSNALVRKDVIVGVWRVLGNVLCNIEEEKKKIEKYLQVIEKKSNEIKISIAQRSSQPQQSLIFSGYSEEYNNINEEDFNNDNIRKIKDLKNELEKDLGRLKEDDIIRDFSQDVQFFVKNAIVEDDAKSTFLGELLRQGEEMKSFDNILINKTRLSLQTIESDDKRNVFHIEQRDENNDLFCCFNSEYDLLFKNNENHFIKKLKNKKLFQQEYNNFLVWLYYDNTTIIRKTLDNFAEDLKSEAFRDVLFDNEGDLIEFLAFKEKIDIKKKSFIDNVIKREYYYSSFLPYLSNGDGIDYVEKLLYVVYAKELLNRLNGDKHDIETDTRALMEVFSNIMGAEKAFWIMKQNKKNSEDYFLYPVSLYSPDKSNSNNDSGDDNNKTVKQKGNTWNASYNPQIIKEKYLTNKVLYSQEGMVKFPLFSFSNIKKKYGEREDLKSSCAGFFIISGLDNKDPQEDYNPNRFLDEELGGNSVVASITFLYNNQVRQRERDFRICFQESGRLLLLLKEEINNYVLKYLIGGKVFDLWVEKFWGQQKYNKIYANSAHVFNYLPDEMKEFDTVDESTIKKLSKTWFVLSNEIISFFYSNIERNVTDPESGKHCLKLINPNLVIDESKIGDIFNDKFIFILAALLESRWKSAEKVPPNAIFINGMPLDRFQLTEEVANTVIRINKYVLRTFIAQCLNNSLAPDSRHGHRGEYEQKNVNITISKSSIAIVDDSQTVCPKGKAGEIEMFNREKEYIRQVKCEKYSSTTLTSLQGIFNYMCDKKENVSCDYGFKNDNFFVIFNFNKN